MHDDEADKDEQIFKASQKRERDSLVVADVQAVKDEVLHDLKPILAKLGDPVVLASLMFKTASEKENTNRLLKNIYARMDSLEGRLSRIEELAGGRRPAPAVLPEVDQRITEFIRVKGLACAEDVQHALKYRGRNAASARLNHLFELGVLEKVQAGRKVFYRAAEK